MKASTTVGICWLAAACAVLSGTNVRAQEGRGRGVVIVPPDGGAVRFRLQSDAVKGAPYSAEVIKESTQTLSDGNRIVRRSSERVYRDNDGRTRREENLPSGPPLIVITDPVAGTSISLDPEHKVARKSAALVDKLYFRNGADRPWLNGLEVQSLQSLTVLLNGRPVGALAGPGDGQGLEQLNVDQLPTRTIEGVPAEGLRRTTTIAAGAIGNERPITVVSEEWTSPDLRILVLSESTDPRVGKTSYRLVNIVRGDPDPALFQIPADYTVQPGAGGRGARGDAPR